MTVQTIANLSKLSTGATSIDFNYKENRPFIGVLFQVENCKYFAPLSSPKLKHLKMIIKLPVNFLRPAQM